MRVRTSVVLTLFLLAAAAGSGSADLCGIVQDAAGNPVAGAVVEALPAKARGCCGGGPILGRALTDGAGQFVIAGAQGEVRLVARDGVRGLAGLVASGGGPYVLRFAAEAWIDARVLDAGGRPLPGAAIRVLAQPRELPWGGVEFDASADALGEARIGPLAPALAVTLEARAPGFRPVRSTPVRFVEGAASCVQLTLGPGEVLRGVVRDERGNAVAGATIEAQQGDAFIFRATSADDGSFSLDGLAPRSARIVARAAGHQAATVDAVPPSGVSVTLPCLRIVEGTIVPARAGLYAVVVAGNVRHRAPIGADGRFRVEAGADKGATLQIETADRAPVASVDVDPLEGASQIEVRLP